MDKEKNRSNQTIPNNLPTHDFRHDSHSSPTSAEKDNSDNRASRIIWRGLIIVIVLIILVALSIGIIKLVPRALSSLASVNVSISSLFAPKERVSVSTDKSKIASGESFNISWKHTGPTPGGYFTISTTCQNNYHLEYPIGNKRDVIDCNHSVQLASSTSAVTLIGVNTGSDPITAPIEINYLSGDTNKTIVTGENSVVINPASVSASSSTNNNYPTPSQTATSTNNSPSYQGGPTATGPGDLVVRITAIGVQDPTTGAFVQTNNINSNNRVIMKFEVENIGGGPSGTWSLTANLPAVSLADQVKTVNNQASIPAGQAVSGELYFDYVSTGQNRIVSITISAAQPELRTDNNTAQATITATGGGIPGGTGILTNGVDLAVRILDTGVVNRSTGQYTATNYVRSSDRGGVRFQVTNQGSTYSGPWTFTANLPTSNNNCGYYNGYYSCSNNYNNGAINQGTQTSLAPGQSLTYIVGFDGLTFGANNTVTINIDPYNQLPDLNRSNNYASASIYVSGY